MSQADFKINFTLTNRSGNTRNPDTDKSHAVLKNARLGRDYFLRLCRFRAKTTGVWSGLTLPFS